MGSFRNIVQETGLSGLKIRRFGMVYGVSCLVSMAGILGGAKAVLIGSGFFDHHYLHLLSFASSSGTHPGLAVFCSASRVKGGRLF